MAGLVGNYLLPGAAGRRQQAREDRQQREMLLAAERARREQRQWVESVLAAEEGAATRPGRSLVRPVRAALWRGRAALRPVYALLVLYAAGWAVWAGELRPAAAVFGTALVAAGWWRLRLRRRLDRDTERTYALACLGGAWLWLCSCAALSPLGREWQLLYPWIVAALIWWGPGRHWPSDYQPPVEVVIPDADSYRRRWEQKLAASGRRLAGSRVVEVTYDEHDAEILIIQLEPGLQTVEAVTLAADNVSSGLRVPQERLIIEQAPEEYNPDGDPTLAQVKILRRNPAKQIQWFLEPRYVEGKIVLGAFLDGIGEGLWRIYDRGRMWGGSLWAGTGYGKSRLLELIAVSIRAPWFQEHYPTLIMYFDGQNGTSSPLLWHNSTMHAGVEESDELLDALIREGEWRQKWNRAHGLTAFYPGRPPAEAPGGGCICGRSAVCEPLSGILAIVDEQHGIVNKGNVKRWERPAREFGKLGIAILGADQITDLSAYADSEVLRSSMLAGNGGAMHIASRTAGNLVPGLPVDPYRLPKIPGYLVKIAGENSGERTAPLQVRYMPDQQAVDEGTPVPPHVRLAEEWFTLGGEAELTEREAEVFGPVYTQRHEREARLAEQLRAELEGRPLRVVGAEPEPAREVTDDQVAEAAEKVVPIGTAGMSKAERVARGRQILVAAGVIPPTPEARAAAAEYDTHVRERLASPPADEPQDGRTAREVIRAYLRERGRAKRSEIVAHVQAEIDVSLSAIKAALGSMKENGEVAAAGGFYEWLGKAA